MIGGFFRALGRNWKAILALLLLIAAIFIHLNFYRPAKTQYETRRNQLALTLTAYQSSLAEGMRYQAVDEQIPAALERIEKSRSELYSAFPAGMLEEDQLLFLEYLQSEMSEGSLLGYNQELHEIFMRRFNQDIQFQFGMTQPLMTTSDGAELQGKILTVYYHTTYEGYKAMVSALSNNERITSILYSTYSYNDEDNTLDGVLVLRHYLLHGGSDYEKPLVEVPETGKEDIFN